MLDEKIIENVKWDTRVVIGYDSVSNSIITSFRGTSDKLNWVEDFIFFKTPYDRDGCVDCEVHHGFFGCYNSLV
jgi:hypothetical protein